MEMTRKELRATRKELSTLKKEWMKFKDVAKKTGKAAAKGFGKNFKSAAVFTLKEFSRGALNALGDRWARSLGVKGKKGGKNFGKKAKQEAKQELNAGGGIAQGIKLNMGAMAVVGAAGLAAAAVAQFKGAMEGAIERERLEVAFGALSSDGKGGGRIFEALRQDALRTGVAISDMAGSVQRFMGMGFAEADALQLNRSLLDIAGSLGMTNSEAALLGTALAQVKSKGVASMEELRQQIAEKGVPVFQLLAEKIGVTEAEIIKMVSSGKIGADAVIEAFQNLEGPLERFRGGSDRMGNTLGGLLNRLKVHMGDLKSIFASQLVDSLKPFLEDRIGMIERMKQGAEAFGKKMADVITWIRAALKALSIPELLAYASLKLQEGFVKAFDFAARAAFALVKTLQTDSFETMLKQAALTFKESMMNAVSEVFQSIAAGIGGPVGKRLNRMADAAKAHATGAKTERNELTEKAKSKESVGSVFKRMFESLDTMFSLGEWEQGELDKYQGKLDAWKKFLDGEKQRRKAEEEAANQPGSPPKSTPAATKSTFDPTAGLGGGLANAISRITGGGTIVMDKQLTAMEGTRAAAEKTAAAAEKIVKNTKPKRGGESTIKAQLVLG